MYAVDDTKPRRNEQNNTHTIPTKRDTHQTQAKLLVSVTMGATSSAESTTLPLQDRVAIVTGASRGIGKAIALHLASLGAKIVVNYSSKTSMAEEVVCMINSGEGERRAIAVQADVSNPGQVEALFNAAEHAFQTQISIVVANAGILDSKHPTIADTTVEDFDKTINVNSKGTFLCCQLAAKRIKRGGGGRIITHSSSLTALNIPNFGAYTASKAAIEAMTKILAKELKGTGITVNCIAPGPVETQLLFAGVPDEVVQGAIAATPLGRLGQPQDIASIVGFLVTDSAEWVNGQVIPINGGFI